MRYAREFAVHWLLKSAEWEPTFGLRFAAPAAVGKRVDTYGFYPLNSRFPLFLCLTQTRDRRPLRQGERQRIFSTVGRPCVRIFAVSETVLLHRSEGLRRRGMTVPRNPFARYYRRHLRIFLCEYALPDFLFTLHSPLFTLCKLLTPILQKLL